MTWNYRLIKRTNGPNGRKYRRPVFAVHEVYYDEHGDIYAFTQDPCAVTGDNRRDSRETWEMMKEAFEKPVLTYEHLPGASK